LTKKWRVAVVIDLRFAVRHHHDVFAGIERYAQEHEDWDCVLQPFLQTLLNGPGQMGYHGIIGRATAELTLLAAKAGVPVVNVWSGSPAVGLPSVLPNFETVGRVAAVHLLQRGFRQFAFQGFVRHGATQSALAGFKDALRAAKRRCAAQFISTRYHEDARCWQPYVVRLERWVRSWQPPLGVFAVEDIVCRYLADACLRAGLRIPEDVALVGCGNEPLVCTRPEPSLSSFDLGYERVGYQAAALLDQLMQGTPAAETTLLLEPGELVVRRSTDVCVADDPQVAAALRFIADHSHEGIRSNDVAKHVLTSERSLRRKFLAATGRTITDEIARLRLERAKRQLAAGNESIKQLARDCGFSDPAYFHRVFLQAEGISPGEYRRRRASG